MINRTDSILKMTSEKKSQNDLTSFIYSLFSKKIYAEIYYAWCKDCNEPPSAESAKYFRDELISRNNKDLRNFFITTPQPILTLCTTL